MGAVVKEDYIVIEELVRNMASDFIAEAFVGELEYLLDKNILDTLIVKNHGMNARAQSKDVLYVDSVFTSQDVDFKENIVVHLSKSSIYHQLPEIFFYPLSLGVNSSNKKEVVNTIRKNREKEKRDLDFFTFFDTEIFKEKVKINNRSLNFFSDKRSKKNLVDIFKQIVNADLLISDESFYKLFLNLCKSEVFKENLPELEKLIHTVLGLKVKIDYVPSVINESPFLSLGDAVLGVDLGLSGQVYSEIDDVKVEVQLENDIENFKTLERNTLMIKEVLSFFLISSRKINITFKSNPTQGFILSEKFLGYNSYLN
ncbi:hypothetical protein [Tenacibaculum caenipelagi]|uniref:Type VI secretion system (T6SS) VasB/ImpH family protein n=1 Tax=Tenacibaculum caenipelagi TaxID=1325435 RepID=A0A4R6TPZ3_9FLAO|nr:hypothetical protein [Tenacibaculum caenipelagi]TDQ30359.1 hypothetical protein DFQ07_0702 [Tenacibaculum caenipelagi]